jgi:hypothetical protein
MFIQLQLERNEKAVFWKKGKSRGLLQEVRMVHHNFLRTVERLRLLHHKKLNKKHSLKSLWELHRNQALEDAKIENINITSRRNTN